MSDATLQEVFDAVKKIAKSDEKFVTWKQLLPIAGGFAVVLISGVWVVVGERMDHKLSGAVTELSGQIDAKLDQAIATISERTEASASQIDPRLDEIQRSIASIQTEGRGAFGRLNADISENSRYRMTTIDNLSQFTDAVRACNADATSVVTLAGALTRCGDLRSDTAPFYGVQLNEDESGRVTYTIFLDAIRR